MCLASTPFVQRYDDRDIVILVAEKLAVVFRSRLASSPAGLARQADGEVKGGGEGGGERGESVKGRTKSTERLTNNLIPRVVYVHGWRHGTVF